MSYDFHTVHNYSDATTIGNLNMPNVFTQENDLVKANANGDLVLYTPTFMNGPAESIVNQVPVFSDTTGQNVIASTATIDDTGKLSVSGLKVADLTFPVVDGLAGSVLTTDGAGNLALLPSSASTQSMVYSVQTTKQENLVVGDHIKFENVLYEKGTLVTLDISSPYSSSANTDSIGRYKLKSGSTYQLNAQITNLVLNRHDGYVTLQWFDSDANTALGQPIKVSGTGGPIGDIKAGFGSVKAFSSPTVDVRVELRVTGLNEVISFDTSYSDAVQML